MVNLQEEVYSFTHKQIKFDFLDILQVPVVDPTFQCAVAHKVTSYNAASSLRKLKLLCHTYFNTESYRCFSREVNFLFLAIFRSLTKMQSNLSIHTIIGGTSFFM